MFSMGCPTVSKRVRSRRPAGSPTCRSLAGRSIAPSGARSVAGAEAVHRDGAAEADVVAAVELGLPGDELASPLGREVGVEPPADDPPQRLPRLESLVGAAGDGVERVVEPLPDVAG